MRFLVLVMVSMVSIASFAQGGNGVIEAIPASAAVAGVASTESSASDESRLHLSAGAGVLTFYGDNLKSDPRVSFELRAEYDVSERFYIYGAYVYGQAVVEEEHHALVPLFTPPLLGLRIWPLILPIPQPVGPPTVNLPPRRPRWLLVPLIGLKARPGPVIPFPIKHDAGEEDKDIHIITAGPGLRYAPWERLSTNWDIGAGVVFGDDVDTHLALNTSVRGSWQMTDRAELNMSLMGTLTNTEVGDADLDWGWGGHVGLSVALGRGK